MKFDGGPPKKSWRSDQPLPSYLFRTISPLWVEWAPASEQHVWALLKPDWILHLHDWSGNSPKWWYPSAKMMRELFRIAAWGQFQPYSLNQVGIKLLLLTAKWTWLWQQEGLGGDRDVPGETDDASGRKEAANDRCQETAFKTRVNTVTVGSQCPLEKEGRPPPNPSTFNQRMQKWQAMTIRQAQATP